MVRYNYNQQVFPPAPFVYVTVNRPDGPASGVLLPALLDTAADRSVIPYSVVSSLRLVQLDETPIVGFGGHVTTVPTYFVEVQIRHLTAREVEAVASPDEPYCLLGRDILNGLRISLDGPGLTMEIE